MKAPRPRMDVNLEELDQIIDGGMRAPLSESDGEKLKAVIHILAERVKPRWRTTEKTSAVLPQPPGSEPAAEKAQPEGERQPAGHGRNGAARFTSARIVRVQHKTLHPGDICPECGVGKVYRQKEPKTLVRIIGRPPLVAIRLSSLCPAYLFSLRFVRLVNWPSPPPRRERNWRGLA